MTWWLFLVSAIGPLLATALTYLGIGFVTFLGFSTVVTSLKDGLLSQIGGLPSDILAYLTLGGFTDGLGILLGAIAIKVAIMTIPVLGKSPVQYNLPF